MGDSNNKFAVMTTVRNDSFFLPKWIQYYGDIFGYKNLFVILDGHDQTLPSCLNVAEVNFIRLPQKPSERTQGDRRRARVMSHFAHGLFLLFDSVLAMDVDEFLVVDPLVGQTLSEYLESKQGKHATLSGLGLDVGQHMTKEGDIDLTKPFLSQRSYANINSRYTKPIVAYRPVTWGSGMHRVKGKNYHIDENLYLFHFGMLDYQAFIKQQGSKDLLKQGWEGHIKRRGKLFDLITDAEAQDWDKIIPVVRRDYQRRRYIFGWNKPSLLAKTDVVVIAERFHCIV